MDSDDAKSSLSHTFGDGTSSDSGSDATRRGGRRQRQRKKKANGDVTPATSRKVRRTSKDSDVEALMMAATLNGAGRMSLQDMKDLQIVATAKVGGILQETGRCETQKEWAGILQVTEATIGNHKAQKPPSILEDEKMAITSLLQLALHQGEGLSLEQLKDQLDEELPDSTRTLHRVRSDVDDFIRGELVRDVAGVLYAVTPSVNHLKHLGRDSVEHVAAKVGSLAKEVMLPIIEREVANAAIPEEQQQAALAYFKRSLEFTHAGDEDLRELMQALNGAFMNVIRDFAGGDAERRAQGKPRRQIRYYQGMGVVRHKR